MTRLESPPSFVLGHLRQMHAAVPEVVRWRHWIAGVDAVGRVRLPAAVRPGADDPPELAAVSRDRVLVLRRHGRGSVRRIDRRGRVTLPVWLRCLVGPAGAVVISASVPDAATVVVTPAVVLDAVVDGLSGEVSP